MRTAVDLNFNWKYADHFTGEMLRASYDDSAWETVHLPHTNKELPYDYFNEKDFQFVCCYRKSFRVPAAAFENGRRVLLHFEGAANRARVFINGKPAGSTRAAIRRSHSISLRC